MNNEQMNSEFRRFINKSIFTYNNINSCTMQCIYPPLELVPRSRRARGAKNKGMKGQGGNKPVNEGV
jgi:hypothetical protein